MFGIKHNALFILNCLDLSLHYSKKLDTILIYSVRKNLYLKGILSFSPLSLKEILTVIPEKCADVVLQFYPNDQLDVTYQAIPAKTKGEFMASPSFEFSDPVFRWSELARC
jgi:hypothetical protein